jgi:hypothetical protein
MQSYPSDGHLELLHLEGKTLKQLELREQVQRPQFLPCLGQFNQNKLMTNRQNRKITQLNN